MPQGESSLEFSTTAFGSTTFGSSAAGGAGEGLADDSGGEIWIALSPLSPPPLHASSVLTATTNSELRDFIANASPPQTDHPLGQLIPIEDSIKIS
jgi:hypothetical protein